MCKSKYAYVHVSACMYRQTSATMDVHVGAPIYWSQTSLEPSVYVEEGEEPNCTVLIASHEEP